VAVHSLHTIAATVYSSVGASLAVLSIKEANLTLDDSWAPYVQGTIVAFAPDQSTIEALTPYASLRVHATATQSFGTGTEWNPVARSAVTRTFDLVLISTEVDHNEGTMTLAMESDEALLRAYTKLTATPERTYGLSVKDAVVYALAKVGATLQAGAADASLTSDTLDPVRTNLVLNPSAGTNVTSWATSPGSGGAATAARVATGGPPGIPTFYRNTVTTASPAQFFVYQGNTGVNVTANTEYMASMWVRSSAATQVSIVMQGYTSGGAGLTGGGSPSVTLVPNVWTQLKYNYRAESTAATTRFHVRTDNAMAVGVTFDVTGMLLALNVGTNPETYFDGSNRGGRDASLYSIAWTGTAHASTSTLTEVANTDATIWLPGVTAWDWVSDLVSAGGLRLFCDEQRRWFLVSSVILDGLITLSPQTGIERATDTRSLQDNSDYYTGVLIRYQAPSDPLTGLTPAPVYDIAGTQGRVLTIDRDVASPGPGAASAILNRAVGKGRTLSVTNESNYETTPGKSLNITLPGTPIQTGSVSSVSWSFPDARMTVGSKGLTDTPVNAWTFATGTWAAATGTWAAATGTN
jgi:hypothetical protein